MNLKNRSCCTTCWTPSPCSLGSLLSGKKSSKCSGLWETKGHINNFRWAQEKQHFIDFLLLLQ